MPAALISVPPLGVRFFLSGGGSTSLSSWIAIGGRSLVKSRNQKPNQQNEPNRIAISTIDGR